MKQTHISRRPPKRNDGFSWGRYPDDATGQVIYRLWRRDHRGALHMSQLVLEPWAPMGVFASQLRTACHGLRDQVDEIDLRALYAKEQAA
jgi:hypothetical protein